MDKLKKLLESTLTKDFEIIKEETYILNEGIEEVKKYFPNIPEDIFQKLVDLDPTYKGGNRLGNYGKWILQLYNKGLIKPEDFNKVSEYLITYKDNLSKMPNKDISKYKTLDQLGQAVKAFYGQKDVSNREQKRELKKGAERVLEDNRWLCITPKTKEAAVYYGANTKWCTSAENNNMFDDYNRRGPLYIFIDKVSKEKYQFHAQSLSFMDEFDNPAIPAQVLDEEMKDFVLQKIEAAMRDESLDIIEEAPLEGLTYDDNFQPIIVSDSYDFFHSIFSYDNGTKEEQMCDILCQYYDYGIDEIYDIIRSMSIGFADNEKVNKLKDSKYQNKLKDLLDEIKGIIIEQINEKQDYWKIENFYMSKMYEELRINVYPLDPQLGYIGSYEDVIIDWFMYNNTKLYMDNMLDDVVGNIMSPFTNLEDVTKAFIEGLKRIFDEMGTDDHIKESIIKNPSFELIRETLKEQDLGFTFNPIKNDLTIYKDISLMEDTDNLSGILSPKLVEIKSDDEEYTKKVLSNSLKKIFPEGYKIIVY